MKNKNLLVAALVLIVVGGAVFYLSQQKTEPVPEAGVGGIAVIPPDQVTEEPSLEPSPLASATAEPTKTDAELIREAMAEKHGKTVDEVNLTISDNTGTYAKGGVSFSGEMGGGWWLAAKTDEGWTIAADGNGTVMCDLIEPYDFPSSLVPQCWDEASSELISR